MRNKIIFSLLFLGTIIFLELTFNVFVFKNINLNIFYTIKFSLTTGLILLFFILFFKMNRLIIYSIISLMTIFFISNFIYYQVYESVISIESFIKGKQVFQFYDQIIEVMKNNIVILILFLVPLIIITILDKKHILEFNLSSKKSIVLVLLLAVAIRLAIFDFIMYVDKDSKDIYINSNSQVLMTKNFGLITEFGNNIMRTLIGEKEQTVIEEVEEQKPIDKVKEYNTLDIDFNELANNETDPEIKKVYQYFNNQLPTEKNEYTGMFKDKNLIVFVAEAFTELAIDEQVTPNLYKLYNEGFQFKNFYSPIFPVSTADGEFLTDTSLIPMEKVWSTYRIRDNYMPFSYANLLEPLGYSSNSYHNHTATYYSRDLYLKAMGYDSYKACKSNLNINCRIWPESDLEMMQATVDDYIKDDKFLAYYMTVSGHLLYTRTGNNMVRKNWDLVKDLPYSDKAKGYLAANIELDKAIGYTLQRLEEAGKLEDTVIIISSDHYPYGLTLSEMNELSSYVKDDVFEKHRNAFIVWSGSMKEPIVVDKVGSSLDVLPTMLNLFGIEYDSRLLMGKDILSTSTPLVIYSNRSFITDKGRYNSINKSFDGDADNQYISNIQNSISNKYIISKSIIQRDFYMELYKDLGKI